MAVFVLSLGLSYYLFDEYRFRFRLLFVTNLHVAYFSRPLQWTFSSSFG